MLPSEIAKMFDVSQSLIHHYFRKFGIEYDKTLSNLKHRKYQCDHYYFDVINMSHKINCPVLASIGTVDDVCPAEFFYEAYLNIPNPKEIFVYEGYGHGGFEELHLPIKYDFVARNIK